jgi:TonB family protein
VRTALWYLFSLSVHGSAMALLYCLPLPGHYVPPRFSVSGGDGGGDDGGDGFVQAAFFKTPRTVSAKFAQQALSAPSPLRTVQLEVSTEPVVEKTTQPVEAPRVPMLTEAIALEPQTEVVALRSPASARVAPGPIAVESVEKPLRLPRATARVSPDDLVDAAAAPEEPQRGATERTNGLTPGAMFAGHSPGVSGRSDRLGEGLGGAPGSGRGSGLHGGRGGAYGEMPSALASNPTPSYPPDALAHGVEGRVLLRVWIRDDGTVQDVKVHRSSGDKSLDESALLTVREKWQFTPAQENGISVPCEALLPIRFMLHGA